MKKPKIRFKGFTETWEQRRLGNVFKEYSEKNHGELPALTIVQGQGTINRNESERNLMYEKSNLSSYKMVRKNDFIVHLRSFEGGLEIATLDGIISPAYHTLHGDNTDSRFYYSYFRSYEFINHGLVPHVYGIRDGRSIDIAGMKTILIPYTSFDEQKKIGNYIETIDRLITLHQCKYFTICDKNRFAWEQRKLDEVITRIGTGLNPRDNFTLNSGGENYYVTIKNFVHGHLSLDDNCDKVDDEALKRIQERSDLCVNDILFTSIGRIGDCYLIKKQPTNWNINESVFTLRPNLTLVEPEYIYHTIHSDAVLNQIINGITGSTFKSIKIADLKKVNIPVPSKAEQKQIAAFISIIDHLITLHQRKCENLKKLKKFMLQKMFPQNGENVPKIRFYNFTDTWEQRKLEDFGVATGGTSIESEFIEDGKYKVISIGSYSECSKYVDQGIRTEKTPKTKNRILNKNDLAMILNDKTSSGKIIGRVLLIDADDAYVYNQRTERIEVNHNCYVSEFLYHLLNADNIRAKIIRTAQGNTQIYVNWNVIKNFTYDIPINICEQIVIGDCFSKLDDLITLHQSKCDNLKELKKYMLQNMFI